jgi:flagellar basal body-associated protein FliL
MSVMISRLTLFLHVLFVALFLTTASLVPAPAWASAGGGEKKEAKKEGGDEEGGGAKDKKKKGQETVTGGTFEGEPVYVHLRPVIFPIISDSGAEQIVVLLVDLQIKDVDMATKMSQSMPRLRDTIIRGLYGGLSDGSMRNANALDIDKIKANIVNACNKVFGEGTVLDALIQAVSQRKL